MGKKKASRAQAAAAGTKNDPKRAERGAEMAAAVDGAAGRKASATHKIAHPEWAPAANSARERRTAQFFVVVEVLLALVPVLVVVSFVMLKGRFSAEGLQSAFSEDPAFMLSFLAACVQPFAAYLLRIVHQKYLEGDAGYTVGNLIALLCSEMFLQNLVGVAGMALLLWRVWKNTAPHMGDWTHERRLDGVLFDISGALVVFAFALICAFANLQLAA